MNNQNTKASIGSSSNNITYRMQRDTGRRGRLAAMLLVAALSGVPHVELLADENPIDVTTNHSTERQQLQLQQQALASNRTQVHEQMVEEDMMKLPLYMRTIATLACLIIFTIGVCGNLLVPLVVIKTKYLRNSTNLFLINLSVADLLVLIVCMPTVLIELHSRPETWLLGEPMCKLSNFVEMLAANGSIFTILAISFERYYAICKPLKAGYKCTRLRATIIICLIWLLAFVLTSPILIIAKSSETIYIDGSLVNNCILETDTYWHKMYVFVSMFAFFCLPLLVLMLVYWLIGRRLIRENLAMSTTSQLAAHSSGRHGSGADVQEPPGERPLSSGHSAQFLHAPDCRQPCRMRLKSSLTSLLTWHHKQLTRQQEQREPVKERKSGYYRHLFLVTKRHPSSNRLRARQVPATPINGGAMQNRRAKPGKAYSLDNQHLFACTSSSSAYDDPTHVITGGQCQLDGRQLPSESGAEGQRSLINQIVYHLFHPRAAAPSQQATTLQLHEPPQQTNGSCSAAQARLQAVMSSQHRGENGFMMQSINEQPNGSSMVDTTTHTCSDLSTDEQGSQAPFLGRGLDDHHHQVSCGCIGRTAGITAGKRRLCSGSSLSGRDTPANRRRLGFLRGSGAMNRRQLSNESSSCSATVPAGSRFTRWAMKFRASSTSSASMLTTTSTALAPEVASSVSAMAAPQSQEESPDNSNTFAAVPRDASLIVQSVAAQRPKLSCQEGAGADNFGPVECQKYLAARVESSEKRRVGGKKCARFGSVSTTNCSSPIPSSSTISESSVTSPYSSSSKSPSPDSIYAQQQQQPRRQDEMEEQQRLKIESEPQTSGGENEQSKALTASGTTLKSPSNFYSMVGVESSGSGGSERNFETQVEKLSKVFEMATNCDSSGGRCNQVPDGDRSQIISAQPRNKQSNESVSKSVLVKNNHDGAVNLYFEPSITDERVTPTKKLRQLRDEHKSLDIAPTHHQNHHHFHLNLKRSNKRSGSQPVVCSHLSGQNGASTKLSELMITQDHTKKIQMDSRRQVVIMLAFVVACFFLLFFPYRVFTIWLILSTEAQVQSLGMETYYNLTYFSRILIYLHSAINPIAYNLISTKFRCAFMSILLCRGSSTRRHFTTEHRIINRRMTVDDHRKSLRQITSNLTR